MAEDLVLKSSCEQCGEKSNLYGSNCKHMTICLACGKTMAETKAACSDCGVPVTRLIHEYNVRASNFSSRSFSIGTFKHGIPNFSKKKGSTEKWLMHKEGQKASLLTDAMQDKYKKKPWIIEDETSREQYEGRLEGSQGTYYVLMTHGKEFLAIPVDAWYRFSKVAKHKQFSLEEAEEKMKNRRRTAEGFSRWMMKIKNSGSAKDCEVEKLEGGVGGGRGKKGDDKADDNVLSDKGEEDEDEEEVRKNRLGLHKIGGDDDEEEVTRGDLDADDDDIEKGDDWEHDEVFTDDDEAVGSDTEDEDESDSKDPAPPEIKQDEEEGEGLSTSGKELLKLLERQSGLDNYNRDKDVNEETHLLPVLATQKKDFPKEEPIKTTATKAATPTKAVATKSAKGKRNLGNDDVKPSEAGQTKRQKTEDSKSTKTATLRDDGTPGSRNVSTSGKHVMPTSNKARVAQATGVVTEEELLNFLRQMGPVTTQHVLTKFRSRIKKQEEKTAFSDILKKISRFKKRNGVKYLVLRNI